MLHSSCFIEFGLARFRSLELHTMATTDLKLDEPGSLPRPGPVGRLVRLAFGALCLWYVSGLVQVSGALMTGDGHIRSLVWNGVLPGLFLVSYVINIGYSRAWKKWPAIASAGALFLVGAFGYLTSGVVETEWLAGAIWVWALYVFTHLGMAFVLSGIIGYPASCYFPKQRQQQLLIVARPPRDNRRQAVFDSQILQSDVRDVDGFNYPHRIEYRSGNGEILAVEVFDEIVIEQAAFNLSDDSVTH